MTEVVTLGGRYQLGPLLGEGSTAQVYRALDLETGATVAVKFMLAGESSIPQARERFAREAEILARVRSPHVVPVLDHGEVPGRPYLVMEYVEAQDLAARLDQRGPFPPEAARQIAAGIARGLRALHAGGVVHRDLKPANVLLDAEDVARITDLGLARARGDGRFKTRTGMIMGTPGFMAPEVLAGRRAEGPADLYALGVILYVLHRGALPFQGTDAGEVLKAQVRGLDPGTLVDLAPATADLVAALTQLAPEARPDLATVVQRLEAPQDAAPAPDSGALPTVAISATRPPDATYPTQASMRGGVAPAPPPRARSGPILGSLGVAVLAALGLWGWRGAATTPSSSPPRAAVPLAVGELTDALSPSAFRGSFRRYAARIATRIPPSPDGDELRRSGEALKQLMAGSEDAEAREHRRDLADFLRSEPWWPAYARLTDELPPSWWTREPTPGADPGDHRKLRRLLARRLAELGRWGILADALGGTDPAALPRRSPLLAPALELLEHPELPDRADEIPALELLFRDCKIFTTRSGESLGTVSNFMLQVADPPSCDGRQHGAPGPQVEVELPPRATPGPSQDLHLFFCAGFMVPSSFLDLAVLDGEGRPLAVLPVGTGRRIVFRRFVAGKGPVISKARAFEVRVSPALHGGEARRVRLRFRNFVSELLGVPFAGVFVAGMGARVQVAP